MYFTLQRMSQEHIVDNENLSAEYMDVADKKLIQKGKMTKNTESTKIKQAMYVIQTVLKDWDENTKEITSTLTN